MQKRKCQARTKSDSDLQPIDTTSSPTIGNTFVVGMAELSDHNQIHVKGKLKVTIEEFFSQFADKLEGKPFPTSNETKS